MTPKLKNLLACSLMLISTSSFATLNLRGYQKNINEINNLEANHDYKSGALKASVLANQIANELKIDQVVSSIDDVLNVKSKEVVTSERNLSGAFNILNGLVSGSGNSNYDTTKILVTNPEEVSDFSNETIVSFEKLQKRLKKYVKRNETDIFYAKILSAKALQLASKMNVEDIPEVYNQVTKTAQRVSRISFLGTQNILNCNTISYAEREEGTSVGLKSFLISFNLEDKTTHHAYEETKCSSSENTTELTEEDLASFDLMTADQSIETQGKALSLKMLEVSAPNYPTWGW